MSDNKALKALKLMGIEPVMIHLLTSSGVSDDEWKAIEPDLKSIRAKTESLGEVVELFCIDLDSRHGTEEAILAKVRHVSRKTKKVTYTFDLCLNWSNEGYDKSEKGNGDKSTLLKREVAYSSNTHIDP
tara:strand:+ start:2023 stop:2409 length:387 start_codon:yes stop_codon:yes gene_type:complete